MNGDFRKAWELLTLGETFVKWSLEIWCEMSMIISSSSPAPKIVLAQFLCRVDDSYGKAWSYCSRQPDYQ